MRVIIALVGVFLTASTLLGQRAELSDAEIAAAISAGLSAKGKEQGLELREGGLLRSTTGEGSNGFVLVVYTPTTWIQQQASQAAKQYKPFTRADVTPEMLQPVLRVQAHPDTPRTLNAEARARAASVDHIVLRDPKGSALQPLHIEPFDEAVSNALGAKETYTGKQATFALDAVRALRGPNGAGEFAITVIGEGRDSLGRKRGEKRFDIKRGQFARLP